MKGNLGIVVGVLLCTGNSTKPSSTESDQSTGGTKELKDVCQKAKKKENKIKPKKNTRAVRNAPTCGGGGRGKDQWFSSMLIPNPEHHVIHLWSQKKKGDQVGGTPVRELLKKKVKPWKTPRKKPRGVSRNPSTLGKPVEKKTYPTRRKKIKKKSD